MLNKQYVCMDVCICWFLVFAFTFLILFSLFCFSFIENAKKEDFIWRIIKLNFTNKDTKVHILTKELHTFYIYIFTNHKKYKNKI